MMKQKRVLTFNIQIFPMMLDLPWFNESFKVFNLQKENMRYQVLVYEEDYRLARDDLMSIDLVLWMNLSILKAEGSSYTTRNNQ